MISVLSNDLYFEINNPYWMWCSFEKPSLAVVYAKILHQSFIPTIYKSFKLVRYLSRANQNLETCMSIWFVQLRELK